MDAYVADAVVTGHERLMDSLTLPDPNDRHLLAAMATNPAYQMIRTLNSAMAASLVTRGICSIIACATSIRSNGSL
jgi:hypothetical protein